MMFLRRGAEQRDGGPAGPGVAAVDDEQEHLRAFFPLPKSFRVTWKRSFDLGNGVAVGRSGSR